MKIAFLILGMLILAGWIFARQLLDNRTWRLCIRCGRYFSDMGDISDHAPLIMDCDEHENTRSGVCADCAAIVEFQR